MSSGEFSIDGQRFRAPAPASGLYIVATPIGNLGDITVRALQILAGVNWIACEDTRVTRKLLARYSIQARLTSYHEHNAQKARPKLLRQLADGSSVALVSDAGTPLISDPGYKLVREARAAGLPVFPIPGANAALAALMAGGVGGDEFLFAGFPPVKASQKRDKFARLMQVPATLILYESPRRLRDTLAVLAEIMGPERQAVVARELTKMHEDVRSGSLSELASHFDGPAPKGEIVIVVAPGQKLRVSAEEADMLLISALAEKSVSAAAGEVARKTGLDRRDLYKRAVTLRGRSSGAKV